MSSLLLLLLPFLDRTALERYSRGIAAACSPPLASFRSPFLLFFFFVVARAYRGNGAMAPPRRRVAGSFHAHGRRCGGEGGGESIQWGGVFFFVFFFFWRRGNGHSPSQKPTRGRKRTGGSGEGKSASERRLGFDRTRWQDGLLGVNGGGVFGFVPFFFFRFQWRSSPSTS